VEREEGFGCVGQAGAVVAESQVNNDFFTVTKDDAVNTGGYITIHNDFHVVGTAFESVAVVAVFVGYSALNDSTIAIEVDCRFRHGGRVDVALFSSDHSTLDVTPGVGAQDMQSNVNRLNLMGGISSEAQLGKVVTWLVNNTTHLEDQFNGQCGTSSNVALNGVFVKPWHSTTATGIGFN